MKKTNGRGGSLRSVNERRPWLLLANPDNRRVKLFQAALQDCGQQRAAVVSYADVLRGKVDLEPLLHALSQDRGILRIESPGEDHDVERLLIARGASGRADDISAAAALRLREDRGRIRYPRQWFAGYSVVLAEIAGHLQRHPAVSLQNHPLAIRTLFDKPQCQALLAAHGVAVPRSLPAVGSYDELRAAMEAAGLSRVFVKLNGGSSASGVVAFTTVSTRPHATTSLELVRLRGQARFYNNLKLAHYHHERDLRTIFDFLCAEGAQVEEWLPKVSQAGRNLDLRVVTIAGRPQHMVVRTSLSPLTNLHLGNRRGDLDALRSAAGERWQMVLDLCERAAALFPTALYVGWDILLTPGFRRALVLEGNAFGDLLPGVTFDGHSTHAQAIAAMLADRY